MRRLNFLLTGLLAVLLASCNQRVQNIENKPAVKIDTVLSADKQTALQFPGRVKAAQDISLAFRVSGTIQRMYVNDGAYVRKGQLLAELDPTAQQVPALFHVGFLDSRFQFYLNQGEVVVGIAFHIIYIPHRTDILFEYIRHFQFHLMRGCTGIGSNHHGELYRYFRVFQFTHLVAGISSARNQYSNQEVD